MKRIIAILLVVVMVAFTFVSCDDAEGGGKGVDPAKLFDDAREALLESSFAAEVSFDFECDNSVLESNLAVFSLIRLDAVYDEGDMYMCVHLVGNSAELTLVDGTAYASYNLTDYGSGKVKLDLDDGMLDGFMGETDGVAQMKASDFSDISYKRSNGAYVITCKGISEEMFEGINEGLGAVAEQIGDFAINDFKYVVTVKGNKIIKEDIVFDFVMLTEEGEVSITMTVSTEYDYDADVNITAPADADSYLSYDEAFGDMSSF